MSLSGTEGKGTKNVAIAAIAQPLIPPICRMYNRLFYIKVRLGLCHFVKCRESRPNLTLHHINYSLYRITGRKVAFSY